MIFWLIFEAGDDGGGDDKLSETFRQLHSTVLEGEFIYI